jgi:murein L,D-transpeptidase YcbB/YkuD
MRASILALALLLTALPASSAPAGDPDWHIRLAPADAGPPDTPDAVRLQAALDHYQALAAAGGWPALPAGPQPAPGERDPRVVDLRERLRLSGDFAGLPGTADAWFFDADLQRALTGFQQRHGLPASGETDERTLAALNVPVDNRVRQLKATLTRWHWLPRDLGTRYLWANVPGGSLELIEDGAPLITMRIIAGHPGRPTPSFADSIRQIVVNPSWSVPRTIAVEDLLPSQQEDPGFLPRLRIRVLAADGREVDPAQIDWRQLNARNFPYRLRQDPGPANSLGRLKFVLNNPWDIFLHDTPSRRLFDLNSRTLSSGCLRLEQPEELANLLLVGAASAAIYIEGAAEAAPTGAPTTRTRTLTLPAPITVYVVYLTSWVTPEGIVHFRPDVYGRDARLR